MILNRKSLTTALSILVCVLLAAAILKWSDSYRAEREAQQALESAQAVEEAAAPAAVYTRLTYYNGSTTLDFVQEEGVWYWTADHSFPLDDTNLRRILDRMEALESLETMEAPEDLEEYDLGAAPAATLTASGETEQLSLVFGKEREDGNRYALRNGDSSIIHILPDDLLEPMSVPIYDMMVLPRLPAPEAQRIDFIRIYGQTGEDGSYATYTILTAQRPDMQEGQTLTPGDVTWRSNGANVTDDPDVQALLADLAALSIDKCMNYNPSAEAVTLCGFDAPTAILEVDFLTEGGAEQSLQLTVGSPVPDGSGHYVRCGTEDPTVYRLPETALDALLRIAQSSLEG